MCGQAAPVYPKRSPWVEHMFAWILGKSHKPMERVYGAMKDELFAPLEGRVLEIGPGTGINFQHYPKDIELLGVEPNPYMEPYLETAAEESGLDFTLLESHAETTPLEDGSVDAVVSTLVLCSVFEPERVVAEILRVLKPGGKFYFIEHVAAPRGTWLRRVQGVLRPVWGCFGDGCRPDRETWTVLENAGFAKLDMRHQTVRSPLLVIDPHIIGSATK